MTEVDHPCTAARPVTSRMYETESDLIRMQEMLMEARSQGDDWRYAHVGLMMWNYFMVTCHLIPQEYVRLWHDAAGKLVAYALLGEDPSFECQVLPACEGRGIEEEALAWAEARIAGLHERDPEKWSGPLVSSAAEDDVARLAFLEAHGFRLRGTFSEVNMLRSLAGPVPDGVLPPGFHVRSVAPGETADRAAAERDVWLPWTVGDIDGEDYARLMALPGYDRDLDVVAVDPAGVIAAYVNCWIDPVNRIGDFGPVGARPAYRRRGLTRAVLLEGLRRFKARGMDRACVSTTWSNEAALRLYESVGFRADNKTLDYVKSAE